MASLSLLNLSVLIGAGLVLAGILASLAAARVGAPVLLVFLGLGMLAGEDGPGGLQFSDYRLTYLVGAVVLALVLFDGGMRTRLSTARVGLWPAGILATVGVVVTAGVLGLAMWLAFDLPLLQALTLGAVVSSTDAAAVFFLLRSAGLGLPERVAATLEAESGMNDPMAVVLTLLLVDFGQSGVASLDWQAIGVALAIQAVGGLGGGLLGGRLLVFALNRLDLPAGLGPLLAACAAVLLYAAVVAVGGSGFLAVYLAGLVVGNRPVRGLAGLVGFNDALTFLAQLAMFLMLGLLVTPSRMLDFLWPSLFAAFVLMLVARPAAVFACLAPFRFAWRESAFVAWVGLRGAVAIFLSSIPVLTGSRDGDGLFHLTFAVVLLSLAIQGSTLGLVARRLGLAERVLVQPPRRATLDLPGRQEAEVAGYPVVEGSGVLSLGSAGLPRWARPLFVAREGKVLTPSEAGGLRPGDVAYVLVHRGEAEAIDRLFAAGRGLRSLREFDGETPAGALARLAPGGLPELAAGETVASLFAAEYGAMVGAGDQVRLGPLVLVAEEVEAGRVTRAALQPERTARR